jgi:hypothetical protein
LGLIVERLSAKTGATAEELVAITGLANAFSPSLQ